MAALRHRAHHRERSRCSIMDDRRLVLGTLKGPTRTHARGDLILVEGDTGRCLYLIEAGAVEVTLEDPGFGEGLVLARLHVGEVFGELSLFSGAASRCATIRALEHTRVRQIHAEDFLAAAESDRNVWLALMEQLSDRLRNTNRKYSDRAFCNVKIRVAHALADLALRSGPVKSEVVYVTRTDLGRMVNCSREMAGQAVLDLVEEGLVSASGRCIRIHDSGALAAYRSDAG